MIKSNQNLIKLGDYFLFISFFFIALAPTIIFHYNFFSFKFIYYLIIVFPIIFFFKEINKIQLIITTIIYLLIFIFSQKLNVIGFILPSLVILLIINNKERMEILLILTCVYLLISVFLMFLQKNGFMIFDFLNIETSAEKKIILRRPPTVFPFQVYFNQLVIFFIILAILFNKENNSKYIIYFSSIISALSGSMLLIGTQVTIMTLFYLKKLFTEDVIIKNILILTFTMLISYYFFRLDHSYNYNLINLIFSVIVRIYDPEIQSILNINKILFILLFIFSIFILIKIDIKFLKINLFQSTQFMLIILLIFLSQSANLNYSSLFFSIFVAQISYIVHKTISFKK